MCWVHLSGSYFNEVKDRIIKIWKASVQEHQTVDKCGQVSSALQ